MCVILIIKMDFQRRFLVIKKIVGLQLLEPLQIFLITNSDVFETGKKKGRKLFMSFPGPPTAPLFCFLSGPSPRSHHGAIGLENRFASCCGYGRSANTQTSAYALQTELYAHASTLKVPTPHTVPPKVKVL